MDNINISNPNDGLGDKVRNAFFKVNNNFTTLENNKADLVGSKVPAAQLPLKVVSLIIPTGVPSDGDEWILYTL